ncbi:unnamed protein product [Caretta caretta]
MESVVKYAFRAPVKQLQCCISADFPEDKDCQALNKVDKKQLEAMGGKAKMLQAHVAVVRPQGTPDSDSFISGLSTMDLSSLKKTTESTMPSLRLGLRCPIM